MELALLLYAASIANNIRGSLGSFIVAFFILGIISGIVVLATGASLADSSSLTSSRYLNALKANRLARKCVSVLFFSWVALMLFTHLVPARRDVYVMAGGYVALKVANNEVVQTTANSVLGSIEKWLDKELTKEMEAHKKAAMNKAAAELEKTAKEAR